MTFDNLSSSGVADAVREQIVAAINRGEYEPGDKLPSEADLGAALGVSRVSVREALRSLQAIDLVEIRHGRGSFVAVGPRERYRTPFAEWLQVHREEVLDLMKVRGALDELAAGEAAASDDEPGVKAIEDAQERFRTAIAREPMSMSEVIAADVAFHLTIAQASGSVLLPHLLEDLNKLFAKSRDILFSIDDRANRSASEHDTIIEAIKSGDQRRARDAAARHLESSRKTLADDGLVNRPGLTVTEAS